MGVDWALATPPPAADVKGGGGIVPTTGEVTIPGIMGTTVGMAPIWAGLAACGCCCGGGLAMTLAPVEGVARFSLSGGGGRFSTGMRWR